MKTHLFAAAATLAAALVAAPAAAQDAGDVRCLIVANFFASNAKDERAKEVSALARFFYLGRVAGRMPAATLKTTLATEIKGMTPAAATTAIKPCLDRVDRENKALAALAPQPPAGAPAPAPAAKK